MVLVSYNVFNIFNHIIQTSYLFFLYYLLIIIILAAYTCYLESHWYIFVIMWHCFPSISYAISNLILALLFTRLHLNLGITLSSNITAAPHMAPLLLTCLNFFEVPVEITKTQFGHPLCLGGQKYYFSYIFSDLQLFITNLKLPVVSTGSVSGTLSIVEGSCGHE